MSDCHNVLQLGTVALMVAAGGHRNKGDGARLNAQDVRLMDHRKAGELVKYVVKPFEIDNPSAAREVFEALHGRRMISGFGNWRDYRKWEGVKAKADDEPGGGIDARGPMLSDLMRMASHANQEGGEEKDLKDKYTVRFEAYEMLPEIDPESGKAVMRQTRVSRGSVSLTELLSSLRGKPTYQDMYKADRLKKTRRKSDSRESRRKERRRLSAPGTAAPS